jgi:AcrR family transcriptional regulator
MARTGQKKTQIDIREETLLRIARRLLWSQGSDGLTMDKLAAACPFSKGTIYNHFASKEDLLAGLCIESGRRRLGFLERAAMFKGRSRERAMALAMADYFLFCMDADCWRTEQFSNFLGFALKISGERRADMASLLERSAGITQGVIRDAVVDGDLVLSPSLSPEKVFFSLMGTTRGLYLYRSEHLHTPIQGDDLWSAHEQLFRLSCDALGWSPLSKEWDYTGTAQRIRDEIFTAEEAKVAAASHPQDAGRLTEPSISI